PQSSRRNRGYTAKVYSVFLCDPCGKALAASLDQRFFLKRFLQADAQEGNQLFSYAERNLKELQASRTRRVAPADLRTDFGADRGIGQRQPQNHSIADPQHG